MKKQRGTRANGAGASFRLVMRWLALCALYIERLTRLLRLHQQADGLFSGTSHCQVHFTVKLSICHTITPL